MDEAQVKRMCESTESFLMDRFDCYILVGFTAGDHHEVVMGNTQGNPMAHAALKQVMGEVLDGHFGIGGADE